MPRVSQLSQSCECRRTLRFQSVVRQSQPDPGPVEQLWRHARTILETNGRRWHDDAVDYERDNEKWSVPGRHGFRLVLATWDKVTRDPDELLAELLTTMAAR
jgi:hypothetical protein